MELIGNLHTTADMWVEKPTCAIQNLLNKYLETKHTGLLLILIQLLNHDGIRALVAQK
jgi:hypothetical protein